MDKPLRDKMIDSFAKERKRSASEGIAPSIAFEREDYLECQQKILGYIFYIGKLPALLKALVRLQPKYFEENYRALWNVFTVYNKETSGMVDVSTMRSLLRIRKIKEEKIFDLEKALEECRDACTGMDEGKFIWYIGILQEIYRRMRFVEIQEEGYNVLSEKGFGEARDHVLLALSDLEGGFLEITPEGFISDETEALIASSTEASRGGSAVDFGINSLDNEVLGLRSGDMCLFAGWAGVGKTALMVNTAVHVAFHQRKNPVFITTETVRSQVLRRIFARITRLPDFPGIPVSGQKMKSGKMSEEERESLLQIKPFLKSTPHGRIMVAQSPANATMSWLRGKLLQYETMFKVDVLMLDDIRNMVPSPRRKQEFEEVSQLLRDFKRLARTHTNLGLPVISPYHINRELYKKAKDGSGNYDLSGLASTSEAERQTDIVISLWQDEQNPQEIRLDILKMRDGRTGAQIRMGVEFDYQYFFEMTGGIEEGHDIED